MKPSIYRRLRRRLASRDIAAPKKDNLQDQLFFGEVMHEPFFKPIAANSQSDAVQRKCTDCENEDKAQRLPEKKENEEKVQRAADKKEEKNIQKKEEKNEDDKVMKKEENTKEEKIQKKEAATVTASNSTTASSYISSINGKGQSMDSGVQSFYESRMGADFSEVKIHTGKEAAESAKDIKAQAYAYSNHIVFSEGKYRPETIEGKHLLAHELAHVVQKRSDTVQRDDGKTTVAKPTKKEELIQKIKSGFGIVAVTDTDASFTWQELELVYTAFTKIPAADIAVINGAFLKRVKNAGPTVMAIFNSNQQYNDTNLIDEQSITLADEAFSGTGITPAVAVRAIIHEIGHAISRIETINKTREAYKAGFEYNKAIKKVTDKKAEIAALPAAANKKTTQQLNTELTGLRQDRDTKKTESDTKDVDMQASYANVADFKSSADTGKVACETEATNATSVLNSTDANSVPYRSAIKKIQSSLLQFYADFVVADKGAAALEAANATISSEIQDRNQKKTALQKSDAKNTVLTSLQLLSSLQDAFFSSAVFFGMNKHMVKPVRKFYDFVVANKILPTVAFSAYAHQEWPNKPGEYYADAYSFFITEPKKLETFSKPLFDWFKAGNYK